MLLLVPDAMSAAVLEQVRQIDYCLFFVVEFNVHSHLETKCEKKIIALIIVI